MLHELKLEVKLEVVGKLLRGLVSAQLRGLVSEAGVVRRAYLK